MKKQEIDKNKKFKKGELKQIILGVTGAALFLGGAIVFPTLPIVIGSIINLIEESKGIKIPEQKIKRALKNLEKKRILSITQKDDKVYVEIIDKNNISILKYSIKELFEFKKKNKKWLGKWYMVLFDVPEVERNKRVYLRKFLKNIGFYPYQKSVYVFPYECEKEIKLIKKIVESAKYMSYIIADKIENEQEAKIYFGLN